MNDEQETSEAPPEIRPDNQALLGERNYQIFPSGSSFTERLLIAGEWPIGDNGEPIPKFYFTLTVTTGARDQTGQPIHIQETIQFQAENAGQAAIMMPEIIAGAREQMLTNFRQKMLSQKLAVPPMMFKNGQKRNLRG